MKSNCAKLENLKENEIFLTEKEKNLKEIQLEQQITTTTHTNSFSNYKIRRIIEIR